MRDRNGSASLESSERRVEARGGGDDEAGVTSAHMLFQWGRRQELGPENAKYLIWQGRKEENYSKHRDTDNNWVDGPSKAAARAGDLRDTGVGRHRDWMLQSWVSQTGE